MRFSRFNAILSAFEHPLFVWFIVKLLIEMVADSIKLEYRSIIILTFHFDFNGLNLNFETAKIWNPILSFNGHSEAAVNRKKRP